MEKKIRAAIVGYGNIGKYALEAIEASPDMECVGVVRRNGAADRPAELAAYPVVKHISELEKVDVAILATPTRSVESYAKECLALGINTVDSFDIHTSIVDLRRTLDEVAKAHNAVSVVAAGWDPGSDSDFARVEAAIKADPYFVNDETHVQAVASVDALNDVGHGVHLTRKGVSGRTHNQLFSFDMKINNPALTAQVLVNVARASLRQCPGAYTMIEIPVIDYLPGDRESLIAHLV